MILLCRFPDRGGFPLHPALRSGALGLPVSSGGLSSGANDRDLLASRVISRRSRDQAGGSWSRGEGSALGPWGGLHLSGASFSLPSRSKP